MLHQVNYKYVAENNKLRSTAIIVDAKDVHEARKLGNAQILKETESGHFEITSIKLFAKSKP